MKTKFYQKLNSKALSIIEKATGDLSIYQKKKLSELYVGKGLSIIYNECLYGNRGLKNPLNGAYKDQFFTPPYVGILFCKILQIPKRAFIYDPAIGSGRLFLKTAGIDKHVFVTGIEIDAEVCRVAKALLGRQASIVNDNLLNYRDTGVKFTYCIGNPPMTATLDDAKRIYKATNSKGKLTTFFAYLENAVMALDNGGLLGVVTPIGWRNHRNMSSTFYKWFKKRMTLLLEMPISGHIFVGSHTGNGRLLFSIEVYLKIDSNLISAFETKPIKFNKIFSPDELARLASTPYSRIHKIYPELHSFQKLYGPFIKLAATNAHRGQSPQHL